MLLTRLLGLCKTTGLVYTRWYLWNSGSPLYPMNCAITYICRDLMTLSHMRYSQSLQLKMEHLKGWGLSHLHATSTVCHHRCSITSAASLKPGKPYKRWANVSSRKNLSPEGNCGISHKMQYMRRCLHWFRQECHLNMATVHKQLWKLMLKKSTNKGKCSCVQS